MSIHSALASLAFACLGLAFPARAAFNDKIDVDEGGVAAPGELGAKLHVNTTPSAGNAPRFEGEVSALHGWRVAPEITYGIARDVELGSTLPFVHADGVDRLAGARLAIKWNPIHASQGGQGAKASVQVEYGWISGRFQEETRVLDVTPVLSWRDERWLLAFNPALQFAFSGPARRSRPSFDPALKIARRVTDGFSIGPEYFGALGPVGDFAPRSAQSHTLYLALDVDREPWAVNFGVGRGLNAATDRWTVKAIVELPF